MRLKLVLLPIFLNTLIHVIYSQDCTDLGVKKSCNKNENCLDCMKEHECCNWCLYGQFNTGFSCDTLTDSCNGTITLNSPTQITDHSNETFSQEYEGDETNQIVPKKFNLTLRINKPLNISFYYKPVQKYPLNLYYLVDISYTMKDHIEDLKKLGDDLKELNFTNDYQVGLGSFMDKPLMPFYRTGLNYENNPCYRSEAGSCAKGYLFKHVLNFTDKMQDFTTEVHKLYTSANLDDVDGASSALMQILNCQDEFKWRGASRKQILIATSSLMHWAGDGLLSGSVKSHPMKCLSEENLTSSIYDYPSLGDIISELKDHKTNLIIATKPDTRAYYNKFREVLGQNCFVGELKTNDTKNIMKLLEDGYKQFIKSAEFFANHTRQEFLSVEFYNNCSGVFNKSATCDDVDGSTPIEVIAEFKLIGEPPQGLEEDEILIEERSIEEQINIHVEYKGFNCICNDVPETMTKRSVVTCVHGKKDCDGCQCDPGWTGLDCSKTCLDSFETCRANNSLTCSHNGDCICGRCKCQNKYSGEFCQYRCPIANDRVCNGQLCMDGNCKCNKDFTGELCDCPKSKINCQLLGKACLDNGACVCNQCECNEGFTGKFCNIDKTTNTDVICDNLESCVLEKYNEENSEKPCTATVIVKSVNTTDDMDCSTIYEKKGKICTINFEFSMKENIVYHTEPNCNVKSQARAYIYGGIGVLIPILAVILGLVIWKSYVTRKDRIEYEAFMKEQSFSEHHNNPLYKNPVTKYENPLLGQKNK
ncbi:unnamed protein product [Brassicogethes aeneus]|uniref:Integrin beta n=1 Tax=Brassicogethes aeneus TaxID=1431903 RepID=A0A9P0BEA6_BRAAE|nr:unnamed protein product [Brassicogethes aeneus]